MLRFSAGDRVRCKTAERTWDAGVVVALHYSEPGWPNGVVAPYQVELDNGGLIFAPCDDDRLIRSESEFDKLLSSLRPGEAESGSYRGDGHTVPAAYREDVQRRYPRKHPALFDASQLPAFLDPAFARALKGGAAALRGLWTEEARGLFSLRIFTDAFCTMLLEECEHFEAWCLAAGVEVHRPNTMNAHGAILDDIGMQDTMDAVMRQCVQPLARLAGYSDVLGGPTRGAALETHHAFVVSARRSPP